MKYDYSRKAECINVLHFLKRINITYFFGEGSALAAYRNHGVIKKDHDYDVIIPIWMNSHIFFCNEKISINRSLGNFEYFLSDNYQPCKKTRKKYYDILLKYINSYSDYRNLKMICRKWNIYNYTSCLINYISTQLDLWIIMGNEYTYKNINICKCIFCDDYGYCLKITPEMVRNMYGNDYYIYKERNKGGNNRMKRYIIY